MVTRFIVSREAPSSVALRSRPVVRLRHHFPLCGRIPVYGVWKLDSCDPSHVVDSRHDKNSRRFNYGRRTENARGAHVSQVITDFWSKQHGSASSLSGDVVSGLHHLFSSHGDTPSSVADSVKDLKIQRKNSPPHRGENDDKDDTGGIKKQQLHQAPQTMYFFVWQVTPLLSVSGNSASNWIAHQSESHF